MPQYYYTAKAREKNREVSDIISATDKKELASKLRREGLLLLKAEEVNENLISFGSKVSLKDKIFFTRNLQVMLSGGLSLSRTLSIIAVQTKNKNLRNALIDVREEVQKGNSFSEALDKYPDIFSKMFRSVIKLSQETGKMEENLEILTEQLKKEYELKSKVRGALIYPAVIVFAMGIVGVAMLVLVVPQLAQTFESMNTELPITTRFFIGLGAFLGNNWLLMIFLIVVLIFILKKAVKTEGGKRALDYLLLRTPLFSSVVKKTNTASVSRTLNSLLSSGVSLVRGLDIVSDSVSNIYFRDALKEAAEEIKEGERLSSALYPYTDLFSSLMVQMIEVGEETGETSKVLSEVSDFMEEEVFALTKNLASVIEPVLMILIGGAVGFFAFSMLIPIYSLLEVL